MNEETVGNEPELLYSLGVAGAMLNVSGQDLRALIDAGELEATWVPSTGHRGRPMPNLTMGQIRDFMERGAAPDARLPEPEVEAPKFIALAEVPTRLGLTAAATNRLIEAGAIRVIRLGDKLIVSASALSDAVEGALLAGKVLQKPVRPPAPRAKRVVQVPGDAS